MVAAVVLAAGAATRFGAPKQRLFLPHVLEALRASCVDEIVVVSGAHDVATDAHVVHAPDWTRGPGASLRAALETLPQEVDAAVVVLADGPRLDPRAVDRVAAARHEHPGALAASYDGATRSHPVLIPRALWDAVPDEGARALAVTLVACDDLRAPGDVDTPEGWNDRDGER